MLGAFLIAYAGHGLFVAQGGAELVIALEASTLLLATTNAGSSSVDAVLGAKLPWNRGFLAARRGELTA